MALFTSDTARAVGKGAQFTSANAAEMGRKGGIRSGEVRRERRDMGSIACSMLNSGIPLDDAKALAKQYDGLGSADMLAKALILAKVMEGAYSGDLATAKWLYQVEQADTTKMNAMIDDDPFSKSLRELAAEMEAIADSQSL